jgi:predicted unusual protein kinase regulating ubiquinone biosynthesis (AarF/ABC1/UbiB family)
MRRLHCQVLVDLGPAFVKIGQALSSRPDVLPPAYLAELELLQDRIPPFSDTEALQVRCAAWGAACLLCQLTCSLLTNPCVRFRSPSG